MPTALVALSALCLLTTLNAWSPRTGRLTVIPAFMAAALTIELAPWVLVGHLLLGVLVVAGDAMAGWRGPVALALLAVSAIGLVPIIVRALRSDEIIRDATAELGLDEPTPRFPRSHIIFPLLMWHRRGVRRIRNVVYADAGRRGLRLDIYQPSEPGEGRPAIVQVHGGAWVMGDKREQGVPLLMHLAANGWVGFNVNYRLSPRATFPDQVVDLKRAVAWIRAHATEYGADPQFLCVTGGSAGGHLCSLLALTPNQPGYQEGFEDVDTAVRAAVPFYGVYDFSNRSGHWNPDVVRRLIEPVVMKARLVDAAELFASASPIDQVGPAAPPFFVIHGDLDSLVPVADARAFVTALRAVSRSPVLYAELHGAEHAFDVLPSYRTARVVEGVERFLTSVHRAYVAARPAGKADLDRLFRRGEKR